MFLIFLNVGSLPYNKRNVYQCINNEKYKGEITKSSPANSRVVNSSLSYSVWFLLKKTKRYRNFESSGDVILFAF